MVIDIKYIGGAFAFLVLLQVALLSYFNAEIEEKSEELYKKREIITTLTQLENKYSTKVQREELEKIYKLLSVFDVIYTLKEKKKRKIITMELKEKNADKVLALLVNRNVNIKKLKIEKKDKFTVELIVEIL
ncbi:hypothetical protein [Sulfurimonas sp.]